jgi:hypothetical protein
MSFLRLLNSRRASNTTPRGTSSNDIDIDWHMPGYGCLFMTPPNDPLWPHAISEGPREDELLMGEVHITIPPGRGVYCQAIRLIFRTKCRLNMGSTRGWEEDEIFERRTELIGGSSEGIYLQEGIQMYVSTMSAVGSGAS